MPSKQQENGSLPERDSRGRLLPGHTANPNGRLKGSKNKFTDLKEIFLEALEEVGGKDFVVAAAKADPKAFLTVISKMLPRHSELVVDRKKVFSPIVLQATVVDALKIETDKKKEIDEPL